MSIAYPQDRPRPSDERIAELQAKTAKRPWPKQLRMGRLSLRAVQEGRAPVHDLECLPVEVRKALAQEMAAKAKA